MLEDVIVNNLDVVFCGTAKGKTSYEKGYYYAGSGNKFYRVLYEAEFTPEKLKPSDCYSVNSYRIGLTDLVHSEYGNDNEIKDASYDVEGLVRKIKLYKPKFIAFNGKKSASFVLGYRGITSLVEYGLQKMVIGSTKIYVLPSTSGSARRFWDSRYWIELKSLIDRTKIY